MAKKQVEQEDDVNICSVCSQFMEDCICESVEDLSGDDDIYCGGDEDVEDTLDRMSKGRMMWGNDGDED